MKTNNDHEAKREEFDEICEAIATEQDIIAALKAAHSEKDKLIEYLMDRIDGLEEQLKTAVYWRGCHG